MRKLSSRCFAEGGIVHDEGRDYHGRAAIQRWKKQADAKYRYVLQPIGVELKATQPPCWRDSQATSPEAR